MSFSRIYLDHNATAPIRPEARDACLDALVSGNASSVHAEGRRGRGLIETARIRVAALVGAPPERVVFTSGGTEANNTVLRPGALRLPDGRPIERLLVGATEHASVLSGHCFGPGSVETVPVSASGLIDLAALERLLAGGGVPTLVSVGLANSETGVVQPAAEIAAVARAAGALFHADAVQAAGRIPVATGEGGPDIVTLSGHKLGGPAGAGAIVLDPERVGPDGRLLRGGGQERGLRAGTENVPAIAGFGVAAEAASRALRAGEAERLAALRDIAEAQILRLAPDAVVFGRGAPRLPNTLAFAVPGVEAATILMALDLAGISVSSGSACSSGKVGRSHVLAAMGLPDEISSGALRVSLGWNTAADDLHRFATGFENVLRRLYENVRARAA